MNFDVFFKIIDTEPVFETMKQVKENSPYHREESVFIHTMMVCEEYDRMYSQLEDDYFVGLFACLFHDTGKPSSLVVKQNSKRGTYNSFIGHEIASARIAGEIMNQYNFNSFDILRICWMVEHHQVFWAIKETEKKQQYVDVFRNPGLGINYLCFKAFMLADDRGRICEDKSFDSVQCFKDFEQQYLNWR